MRKFLLTLVITLSMFAALEGRAVAQSLNLEEMGAALALPIVTGAGGDTAVTIATVTNGGERSVILKIDVISGDDGDAWRSTSFDCPLTGRETVSFVIAPNADGSQVSAECALDAGGMVIQRGVAARNGILFVGLADESGLVISQNLIFGDAVIVSTVDGGAWSVGAVPFQAGAGANDGDKVYAFDGVEYAQFPSLVATNFLAPRQGISADLVLFTLDGTTGVYPVPRVSLSGLVYNDDEVPFDLQLGFDCFAIVSLGALGAGAGNLGSPVGHLQLRARAVGRGGFDVHDALYGDANSIRTTPVAGWIFQTVQSGQVLAAGALAVGAPPGPVSAPSPAAWARPIAVSNTAAMPLLGDDPATLDAAP